MKIIIIAGLLILALLLAYINIYVPNQRDNTPIEQMDKYKIVGVALQDGENVLVCKDSLGQIKILTFLDKMYVKVVNCKLENISDYEGKTIYYRNSFWRTGIKYIIQD